jgi:fructoselysine-6-P-deglycase FrlB-like protein
MNWDQGDKGGHAHFMAKDIHEQPTIISRILSQHIETSTERVRLPIDLPFDFKSIENITILGAGSGFNAALMARHWFERFARIPVEVDGASEYRFGERPVRAAGLTIAISQSGETADVVAAQRAAKAQGQRTIAVVGEPRSTLACETDAILQTYARSSFAMRDMCEFPGQMAALVCLAIAAGRARGVLSIDEESMLVRELLQVPRKMEEALTLGPQFSTAAVELSKFRNAVFVGQGPSYPLAREGALSLRSLTDVHTQAFPAGDLKQENPYTWAGSEVVSVFISLPDPVSKKVLSSVEHAYIYGGHAVLFTDIETGRNKHGTELTITLPTAAPIACPFFYVIPLQMLSYHIALEQGREVDRPRNLAKSVTIDGDFDPPRPASVSTVPSPTPLSPPAGSASPSLKETVSYLKEAEDSVDVVDVSAFAPETARVGEDILVQVFLHRLDQAAIARALAAESDPESKRRGLTTLATEIRQGQRIEIVVDAPGLNVQLPVQSMVWRGEPRACQYVVSLSQAVAERMYMVSIRLFLESIPVGSLRFSLKAASSIGTDEATSRSRGDWSHRYRRAFLSYSSSDRVEVLKRAQTLKAVGITFFQDLLSLDPGERWERRLYSEIDRSDLFLLFWSSNASQSEWVIREAEYALKRQAESSEQVPTIMPVIIEGPPIPAPPASLREIHFNDALAYVIAAAANAGR